MDLAGLSIKRPIFISCLVIIMLIVGLISLKLLSVDLYPNVTFPTIVVNVPYPGAGPAEVETLVSLVLEEEISGVSGIEKLRSISSEGVSKVIAEFSLKTDIRHAEQQIRDRVATARKKLPEDIEEPTIRTMDPSDQSVVMIALSADMPPGQLYDLAEDAVKPKIEQVPDVGLVVITGGRQREIQVLIDQDKLRYYEISASQVVKRLGESGKNVPAGKISESTTETVYRTVAEFINLDMINNAVIRFTGNEMPVRVKDLATVVDTLEEERSRAFVNGKPALLIQVYRQSGANTIGVVDNVRAAVEKLNLRLKAEKGAELQVVRDGAQRIRANVYDVYEAIIIGIILTIIVVYLFLGSARSTFITGLALPNSLLGAFILMLLAGFTINIMSLLALSLAVGLLIDDAIVVRENIFRHLEMGKSPMKAALEGTREVSLAVIATTFAIIAVFGPIGFLQGVVGQFFKEFGLTLVFAMLISLFDALTIAPMLSAYFAGNLHPKEPTSAIGRINKKMLKGFDRFQTRLEDLYEKLLEVVLRVPLRVLAINVVLFIAAVYLVKYVPKTFMPPQDNGDFVIGLDLPPGTSLDAMGALTTQVDEMVRKHKEVLRTVVTVGGRDGEANLAEVNVELVPSKQRSKNTSEMKATIRGELKAYSHANPAVKDIDNGTGGGQRPFNINITGENLKELEVVAANLVTRIKNHPALEDVDSTYRPGKPEFQIIFNSNYAAEAGVSTGAAGGELRTLVEGTSAALFRQSGQEYDVRVRSKDDQRDLKDRFSSIMVPNINESLVRLSMISTGQEAIGPANIRREDRARYIQVTAGIAPNGPGLGGAMGDVSRILSQEMKLPPGVGYRFVGQAERFQELGLNMMIAMGLGVLFIFFVLASLYESFITPLAIMLVLPLAAMGAFVALFVTRSSLDLYSMIGCVMLLGLATKNSILMVDYTNQLMGEGMDRTRAIIKAGKVRLRPILMTSFALIAGMMPVAIGLNEASKQRTSMGIAIIGGTISSTLLTLVVIPAAFSYIDRFKNWTSKVFNRTFRGDEHFTEEA